MIDIIDSFSPLERNPKLNFEIFCISAAIIPLLVKSACEACTDEQKKEMKKHLDYARRSKQKEWNELLDKYDPERQSLDKFLASVPE